MNAQELPAKAPDKEISSWTLGIDIAIPNVSKTICEAGSFVWEEGRRHREGATWRHM